MSLYPFLLAGSLIQPIATQTAFPALSREYNQNVIPLLIYFNSENCASCAQFDSLFDQPETLHRMEESYVAVRVNINSSVGKACADIYDVDKTPAVVVADPNGVILFKSDETLSLNEIELLLKHVPSQYSKVVTSENKEDSVSDISPCTNTSSTPHEVVEVEPTTQEQDAMLSIPIGNIESATEPADTPEINSKPGSIGEMKYDDTVSSEPKTIQTALNTHESKSTNASIDVHAKEQIRPETNPVTPKQSPVSKPTKPSVHVQRSYAIQLGFFSVAKNASMLMEKAKLKGLLETRTETEQHNGQPTYRVLFGKASTLTEAQALLADVHELGFKGAVYRQ